MNYTQVSGIQYECTFLYVGFDSWFDRSGETAVLRNHFFFCRETRAKAFLMLTVICWECHVQLSYAGSMMMSFSINFIGPECP